MQPCLRNKLFVVKSAMPPSSVGKPAAAPRVLSTGHERGRPWKVDCVKEAARISESCRVCKAAYVLSERTSLAARAGGVLARDPGKAGEHLQVDPGKGGEHQLVLCT